MTSDLRKTILNTRERWTSSKYNTQIQIHDRNLQESLRHLIGSKSGVVEGLEVAVSPGTMQVLVSPGLGILFDNAKAEPDSKYRWIELLASTAVTLAAADPVNPRWDVIEAQPGVASTGLFSRDIFNPSLGTFTPQNVSIEESPAPVLTARSGTASPTPELPDGITGRVPLAYVYVPGAAATLTVGDTIDCRPLLHTAKGTSVDGGGVSVATTATRDAAIHPLEAVGEDYPGGSMRVAAITALDMDVANHPFFRVGQSYPAGITRIYLYAAPAPYPPGYDASMARRLFRPGSNIGPGARIPSVPAAVAAAVRDCIIVASTTTPVTVDTLIGDHVSGEEINDGTWGEGPLGPSVYLGALVVQNSGDLLGIQQYKGGGIVTFGVGDPTDLPNSQDSRTSSASGVLNYDMRLNGPLTSAGSAIFPDHSTEVRVGLTILFDAPTDYDLIFSGASDSGMRMRQSAPGFSGQERRELIWVSPTGTWSHSETGGDSSIFEARGDGYRDGILAKR